MKIAFYCSSLSRSAGGLYSSVPGLAAALKQLGVNVSVYGGKDKFFERDSWAWGDLPLITHPSLPGHYGLHLPTLAKIATSSIDLFHVHGMWSAATVYGRIACMSGASVVVSPHGMVDSWITKRRPRLRAIHSFLLERPLFRNAYIHALNEAERTSIADFMPIAAERTFIAPNGISPTTNTISFDGKTGCIYLGRLHPKKQVTELIENWRRYAPRNITLTVAGWGDRRYQESVAEQCDGEFVRFVGPVFEQDKSALLARARWFILPSLSEGLPMAVLEAMQHGCIPIVTPQCNLPELSINQMAFEMRSDFSDFSELMQRLKTLSVEECNIMAVSCIDDTRHRTWASVAITVINQYERILRDARNLK